MIYKLYALRRALRSENSDRQIIIVASIPASTSVVCARVRQDINQPLINTLNALAFVVITSFFSARSFVNIFNSRSS